MDILAYTADDVDAVTDAVELRNAASKVDAPWEHPETVRSWTGLMRYGWDGELPVGYVARQDGRTLATAALWLPHWDNTHLALIWLTVHPDARRQGHGSALLDFVLGEPRRRGRSSLLMFGWDQDSTRGFAARHGLERRSAAVKRRQYLDDVDPTRVERLYDEARAASEPYDLVRVHGRTPPDMLDAVAEMTGAINDAPIDDLDIEDEVFSRARIETYESATLARGHRLYRILARHRDSGALAGHTVVAVEEERPEIGDQHDTSVVRSHRGHRLGLLLKADMLRWLADEEPRLRTIDTWNTETNQHMIAVNERLGYRPLGREIQFQRRI